MFDLPPDVPPQYAPIVVAEASQAKQEIKERTIGVCKLIDSRPSEQQSAVNSVDYLGIVSAYLRKGEGVSVPDSDFYAAKATLLEAPKHGVLGMSQTGGAYVVNIPNYEGTDKASILVEMAGYKVTVMYFIRVMNGVPGSTDEGDPRDDKNFCPNGRIWKISLNLEELSTYTVSHNKPLEPTR